jgi:hypothetical protein
MAILLSVSLDRGCIDLGETALRAAYAVRRGVAGQVALVCFARPTLAPHRFRVIQSYVD